MGMKLSCVTVALVALATAACPYDQLSTDVRTALGGSGGGSGGPNVLVVLQQPLTGTAGQILTPAILVAAADTLGRLDTGWRARATSSRRLHRVRVRRRALQSPSSLRNRIIPPRSAGYPAARFDSFQAISKDPLHRRQRMLAA